MPDGQVDTHFPLEARRFEVQVRQKSAEPAQVPHEDEHGVQVRLSCGETNVPDGQLCTQRPWERTKPGRHPVHCSWFTVEATLKFGMAHDVHLAPQVSHSCLLLSAIIPFVP